ncbi:MAG: hypothetical protein APF77_12285 [Clostridia bacterium BRH_c25]|nr:MAG: hypothetical protein APF77_12285 [Clostridia bacterium BRH_c25]
MKISRAWEEQGVTIPAPFNRTIKVLFAPDKEGVKEITFSHALIHANSSTDAHTHDRPELIIIVSGRGIAVCNGVKTPVETDVALWIEAGEEHQMINTGYETLKLATVFLPAYTAEENYSRCMEAAKADRGEV